jgi:hypothetical protein
MVFYSFPTGMEAKNQFFPFCPPFTEIGQDSAHLAVEEDPKLDHANE